MKRRHLFRRHRWQATAVDWNIPGNESTVHYICRRRCSETTRRTYPGLLTIEAARLIRRP